MSGHVYHLCEWENCNRTALHRVKRGMDELWLRVCDIHLALFHATPDHALPEVVRTSRAPRPVKVAVWYAGPRVTSSEGERR